MRKIILSVFLFVLPAIASADEEVKQEAVVAEVAAAENAVGKAEVKQPEQPDAKPASVSVCPEKTKGAVQVIGGILSFVGGAVAAFTPLGGVANIAAFAVDVGGSAMKGACK